MTLKNPFHARKLMPSDMNPLALFQESPLQKNINQQALVLPAKPLKAEKMRFFKTQLRGLSISLRRLFHDYR